MGLELFVTCIGIIQTAREYRKHQKSNRGFGE